MLMEAGPRMPRRKRGTKVAHLTFRQDLFFNGFVMSAVGTMGTVSRMNIARAGPGMKTTAKWIGRLASKVLDLLKHTEGERNLAPGQQSTVAQNRP